VTPLSQRDRRHRGLRWREGNGEDELPDAVAALAPNESVGLAA
jgi:hypothetical protein